MLSRGRTSTETVNRNGSTTTTTTTVRLDGSKVVKRTTTRSLTPPPRTRSFTPPNVSRAGPVGATGGGTGRSKTPPPTRRRIARSLTPPNRSSPGKTFGGVLDALDAVLGTCHSDNAAFEQAVRRCIPSEFLLIASQDDLTQAQEDYYAMEHYNLPCSPSVKKSNAGSVATCALLQLLYENPRRLVASQYNVNPLTCFQVLQEIQLRVRQSSKLVAKPTISSSRPLGPPRLSGDHSKHAPFYIVPPGYTAGTRRALLIGVVGGEGPDLKGPPNDIENIRQLLQQHCGFKSENITVLNDYGAPGQKSTKKNILAAFATIAKASKPKDVVFIQFSGHGGRMNNNLYLVPSDFDKDGAIMDEVILRDLIKAVPPSVYTTMLVDCCYSGTVGDLPYVLKSSAKDGHQEIDPYFDTDTRQEVLRKEAQGGQEYLEWKRARADRRSMMRLAYSPAKFLSEAATATYNAAQAGFDAAASTSNAAATAAAETARSAVTALTEANIGTPFSLRVHAPVRRTRSYDDSTRRFPSDAGPRRGTKRDSANKNPIAANSPKRDSSSSNTSNANMTSSLGMSFSAFADAANAAFSSPTSSTSGITASRSKSPTRRATSPTPSSRRPLPASVPAPRAKTYEDITSEQEDGVRTAAVERSRKEAAMARRSKSPIRRVVSTPVPPRTTTTTATTTTKKSVALQEEEARKAAVEQSRKEAAMARRSKSPTRRTVSSPVRASPSPRSVTDLKEAARRAAIEQSRQKMLMLN